MDMFSGAIDDRVEIAVGIFMDTLHVDDASARLALEHRAAEWDVPVEHAAVDILNGTRCVARARG